MNTDTQIIQKEHPCDDQYRKKYLREKDLQLRRKRTGNNLDEADRVLEVFLASENQEFVKMIKILQDDPEFRPLIFEHDAMLETLQNITELKAEQMLQILTAAESKVQTVLNQKEE